MITVQDQPETAARIEAITRPAWPEFMHHDPVARENWHVLYEHFPEFQFVLLEPSFASVLMEPPCCRTSTRE